LISGAGSTTHEEAILAAAFYGEALAYLQNGLALQDGDTLLAPKLRLLSELGSCYHLMKDYEQASIIWQLRLDLSLEVNRASEIVYSRRNIGLALKNTDNFDSAMEYFKEAVDIFYKQHEAAKHISEALATTTVSVVPDDDNHLAKTDSKKNRH
jgi:tetratricopeptide (TPR) repeat protein